MKALAKRAVRILRNPAYRPIEIWVARAALVYVGGKLGIDLVHEVGK